MEVKASLKYLRIAPRKVRLVADLIRGLDVEEAKSLLSLERKRAAKSLLKLLNSAISNAKNNFHLNEDNLYIKTIRVDQGPTLKRYFPRAQGRATLIQKKTSHIFIELAESQKKKKKRKIERKVEIRRPLSKEEEELLREIKKEGLPSKVKAKKEKEEIKKPIVSKPKVSLAKKIFRRKSI
ncbi:50S ribosomal protein L22 [bacterium]|nr:50S ribosomal protein L22 [bacterium]